MVRPPYWVAQRLMVLGVARWSEFNGDRLRHGGPNPLRLPLPAMLDMITDWAVDGADGKQRDKWFDELWLPPDNVDIDDAPGWSDDELMDGFQAALNTQRQQHAARDGDR